MAVRPLFNGSARVIAGNGSGGALRVDFNFRASVATINTGVETIGNATFEAEASVAYTINYDIRKYGDGVELDTPTFGVIRVFNDDDSNDARTGAVFESADLIGGNALPRSGSVTFTPTTTGTYRIQVEMQQGNGNFGATDDWRIISDGFFNTGNLSTVDTAVERDKGRLRSGLQVTAHEVKTQAGAEPATGVYATTMNAGGTATEESVRVTYTCSHDGNKTTSNEVFRHRSRRNGTSTFDNSNNTSRLSATQHRITRKVVLNEGGSPAFPTAASQLYDSVLDIVNNSALHTNNTRQYDGLGGQAASGLWTYFTAAGAGLTLVDFKQIDKNSAFTTNTSGTVENIWCAHSSTYAEDANGVPTGSEQFEYVATDENMTVKAGRALNARGDPLFGVFVVSRVVHAASGTQRDEWGIDSGSFKTKANGWQDGSHVVAVSTPPSGPHNVISQAYFPTSSSGIPSNREFFAERREEGTPASTSTAKSWPAAASFSMGYPATLELVKGGDTVQIIFRTFDKDIPVDADANPTCKVVKNRGNFNAPFATPTMTKRVGEAGVYEGSFVTTALNVGDPPDLYEVFVTTTIRAFTRIYSDAFQTVPFDVVNHNHATSQADKSKRVPKDFDPTGLDS